MTCINRQNSVEIPASESCCYCVLNLFRLLSKIWTFSFFLPFCSAPTLTSYQANQCDQQTKTTKAWNQPNKEKWQLSSRWSLCAFFCFVLFFLSREMWCILWQWRKINTKSPRTRWIGRGIIWITNKCLLNSSCDSLDGIWSSDCFNVI